MIKPEFSYQHLSSSYPETWKKWASESANFDELIEIKITNAKDKSSIKTLVEKIRDPKKVLSKSDRGKLNLLIRKSHDIYHTSQWTANFATEIQLKDGKIADQIEIVNRIKKSVSLAASGLLDIFQNKTYNYQFPHFYSVIKNIQDENLFPVYFPYWQGIYKWYHNVVKCSYDDLTTFYRSFKVPAKQNKYKSFEAAVSVFHIENLKYGLCNGQSYEIIEKARKLLRKWHSELEPFTNEIHTPMQQMKFINLDTWRKLNETLFRTYIDCYKILSTEEEKIPAKAMIKALEANGILMEVKEENYTSFYTIARELGIYYQDRNGKYFLSHLAQKFLNEELSYKDYLKYYILNLELNINDVIVHPFEEIMNCLSSASLKIDELEEKCIKLIPVNQRSKNSKSKLSAFLSRAIDAGLVKEENNEYTLNKDYGLLKRSIGKTSLEKKVFESTFVGSAKNKQENIVKQMIGRDLPPEIFDNVSSGENSMNPPLNQILFGPPGTGKTDSTVEKALEILEWSSKESEEKKRREENRGIFRSLLNKKIFFVTMHPSYSYEDFVQGIKPKTSARGELLFEPVSGIFKKVTERCIPYLFQPYFPSFLMSVYEEELRELEGNNKNQSQLLELIGKKCNVSGGTIKNYRDYFDNIVGDESPRVGYSDEIFEKNKIDKEFYQELSKEYFKIPKDLLLSAFKNNWLTPSVIEKDIIGNNTRIVLILDEINRANISKVFGELITLLEEDKRIGKENAMSVTLPSGESFSVPSNLYIIGTMNTADKSIALVDIALRRRFQFVPMYPKSTVIEDFGTTDKDIKKTLMEDLNKQLIKQSGKFYKGVDFQIGHAYFLKDNSLSDVINENVIPLLIEYFRNDLEKVKSLMSEVGRPLDEIYYSLTGLLKY
jgi:5-methylcytosine-specific restriction protein B